MHRIDGDGNVSGSFTEGDPVSGQVATQVTAKWLNAVQEEIINAIFASGMNLLNPNDNTQLGQALKLIARAHPSSAWAWGYIEHTGGVTTLKAGHNVDSVGIDTGGAGEVFVLFDDALPSGDYAATVSLDSVVYSGTVPLIARRKYQAGATGAGFVIELVDPTTGSVVDASTTTSFRLSFAAYGDAGIVPLP